VSDFLRSIPAARGAASDGVNGRLLYSVEEAADLLGIGRTFMFHLVATGEIDSFKIGKRRKIPRDALDSFIERLRSEQAVAIGGLGELRLPKQRKGLRD
jgi:excisionase family DNA binding protein